MEVSAELADLFFVISIIGLNTCCLSDSKYQHAHFIFSLCTARQHLLLLVPCAQEYMAIIFTALQAGQEFVFIPKGKGVLVMPIPEMRDLSGIAEGARTTGYRDRKDRF